MIDVDAVVADVCGLLNASGEDDLIWWTLAELLGMADEASDALGSTGAFADILLIPAVSGSAGYQLPGTCIQAVQVALDGACSTLTSQREVDALAGATDGVQRHILDAVGIRLLTLDPAPAGDGELQVVCQEQLELTTGAQFRYPEVFGIYYRYAMLAAARGKASDGAAPDIAAAARERADLVLQACRGLWGGVR
jgi:hypothetical protein